MTYLLFQEGYIMSRFKVVDLSFLEIDVPSSSPVFGGIQFGVTVSNSTGSFSTSASSESNSGYSVKSSFDPGSGRFSYQIEFGYQGVAAGAAAGAAADGTKYAVSYSNVSA
jgi:hypothetical protein